MIGEVTLLNLDTIDGWVLDPSQPQIRLSVEIIIDGKVVGECIADDFRAEVLWQGMSDGYSGFQWKLDAPVSENQDIAVMVKGYDTVVPWKSDSNLSMGDGKSEASVSNICGNIDFVDHKVIKGWARDEARPSERLELEILVDEISVGTCLADIFRKDLVEAGIGDGCHGFSHTFTPQLCGTHQVTLRVKNTNVVLKSPTLVEDVTQGNLDTASPDCVSGWVWAKNRPWDRLSVEILVDGMVIAECIANEFRQDLLDNEIGDGMYCFNHNFAPSLVGLREISVRLKGGGGPVGKPITVQSPLVVGNIDNLAADEIRGWAILRNTPDETAEIIVELDGVSIGRSKCTHFRDDVWNIYRGHGFYGFSLRLTRSLTREDFPQLAVKVAGTEEALLLNPEMQAALPPREVKSPTPQYKGYLDTAKRNVISGWIVNTANPAEPVTLTLCANNAPIGTIIANRNRTDLARLYPESRGNLAFSLTLQPTGAPLQKVTVRLRTNDGLYELQGSPKSFQYGPPGHRHEPHRVGSLLRQLQAELSLSPRSPGILETPPKVAIIVLNRNGAPLLADLLSSFHEHNRYQNYELIVIDHGSTDDSQSACAGWRNKLHIRFVPRRKNYSFSESNNYAAVLTDAAYLFFVNNDIVFAEDVVGGMVALFEDESIGMVGLRLDTPPTAIPMTDMLPFGYRYEHVQHLALKFATDYWDRPFLPFEMSASEPEVALPQKPWKVPGVTAAAMMMRRHDFEAVGGFHEEYFYGYEDVDLSLAVQSVLGKQVVCACHLRGYHHRSASLKQESMPDRNRNQSILMQRIGGYMRARLREERIANRPFLRTHPLRVGLLVSEVADNTSRGDYFTGLEFAEFLSRENGWDCYLVPRDQWYDLQPFDVGIAMVDGFDPLKIESASPNLILVMWIRNWFDRWINHPRLGHFDQIWVSSEKAVKAFSAKTSKPVYLMRIATNLERFGHGTRTTELESDYCFTGSYFGSWRQLIGCLAPDELPYRFAIFGHGWDEITWLQGYNRGPRPYNQMADIYASTRLVIDDANHTTVLWGSANSRIFDAVAAGCLVITNSQEVSNDAFGGLLPVYNSRERLKELIDHYLSDEGARLALVSRLQEIVLSSHSYQHRARTAAVYMQQAFSALRCSVSLPASREGVLPIVEAIRREIEGPDFIIDVMENRPLHQARAIGADVHIVLTGLDKPGNLAERIGDEVRVLVLLCDGDAVSPLQLREWDIVLAMGERAGTRLRQLTRATILAVAPHAGLPADLSTTERKVGLQMLFADKMALVGPDLLAAIRSVVMNRQAVPRSIARDHRQVLKAEAAQQSQEDLRIAYVLWDYPALSQTFVLNEIRWLIEHGRDVKVYYKTAPDQPAKLDFTVDAYRIETSEELQTLLSNHQRNVIHSHFAYPATTLLTYPAATAMGISFTVMAHAVDIAHYENQKRNKVGEIVRSPLCLRVITLGNCNRNLLLEAGVPANKIVLERQATTFPEFRERPQRQPGKRPLVVGIGRFIEKKGFTYLIEAARLLPEIDIRLYGYGPLEEDLRRQVAHHALGNVFFCGLLHGEQEVAQAYYDADVFALPCVRAANGDMDGLPTVLLEAMGAGLPVVTTDAANIGELVKEGLTGFVCRQNDGSDLAAALQRALNCDPVRLRRITYCANDIARNFSGVEHTMRTLLDIWTERSIDIVLVTHDTGKYKNWKATEEIIHRLYRFTSMPFNLIVVDNKSDGEFIEKLQEAFGRHANFNLICLPENRMCGPASNVGIRAGSSDYVIYICSKEGYVLKHAWERDLVRFMDTRPDVGMAGYLVSMPKHFDGKSYLDYPEFERFRNQHFARENPDRKFSHVQGGLYILRRQAFNEAGPFNEALPQGGMDVEYSYFLESCGWKLADVPNLYCLTVKTRPELSTVLDEFALAAHPLSPTLIGGVDEIVRARVKACNICDWRGASFAGNDRCPCCGATRFLRSIMRLLGLTDLLQRRPRATLILTDDGSSLADKIRGLCSSLRCERAELGSIDDTLLELLSFESTDLLVIDHLSWSSAAVNSMAERAPRYVAAGGRLVLGENRLFGRPLPQDSDNVTSESIIKVLEGRGLHGAAVRYNSQVFEFDWEDIGAYGIDTRF